MNDELETLHKTIRGVLKWRKCPSCTNDGLELQSYGEDGDPCLPTDENRMRPEVCHDCDGLSFIALA